MERIELPIEEGDADPLAGLHLAAEPPRILSLTRHGAEAPADLPVDDKDVCVCSVVFVGMWVRGYIRTRQIER